MKKNLTISMHDSVKNCYDNVYTNIKMTEGVTGITEISLPLVSDKFEENPNLPNWVNRNTVFHVDFKTNEIIECQLKKVIDDTTIEVQDVVSNETLVLNKRDIEEIFFWNLNDAMTVVGFNIKWPNWVIKETVFHYNRKTNEITECHLKRIIDDRTVEVEEDFTEKILTLTNCDIGGTFFWCLGNVTTLAGLNRKYE